MSLHAIRADLVQAEPEYCWRIVGSEKEAERIKRATVAIEAFVKACEPKECCGGVIYRDPGGPEYPCEDCPHREHSSPRGTTMSQDIAKQIQDGAPGDSQANR